ncbi:MAG TPA: hypothetical protein ENJ95_17465 [Bacteroidetes bacterium]|nr:hypothetical protein [Bacteroidota bacterium]
MVKENINIRPHLLWEFNLDSFDFERSKAIVIERVIERGDMKDWKEMIRYYGKDKILAVAKSSKSLSLRDKNFTEIYIHSEFNVS